MNFEVDFDVNGEMKFDCNLQKYENPTSGVTASMRRAVGMEVLKVDLRPREEVSAHWDAEDRGLPRTSRLRKKMMRTLVNMIFWWWW